VPCCQYARVAGRSRACAVFRAGGNKCVTSGLRVVHMSKLAGVRVVVTEIAWDGSIRRGAIDTAALTDAGRWESLIEQVLAVPPPYRAAPDRSVYVIHAGERAVLLGEENLIGSLQELVTAVLAAGDSALAARRSSRSRSHSACRASRFCQYGQSSMV
jgi:hypothetical protein